ncbi:MAG TPA: response regulator transcription factor, partial [Turneriella sp.]|nr:response regulator transcription factor [Turneriella sp.]
MAFTILSVDDHPVIFIGVQAALEKDGFAQIIQCTDYRRIASFIDKYAPEIVLLDLYMPKFAIERDVPHLCRKHPNTFFVAYTAEEDVQMIQRCKKLGFVGYIIKSQSLTVIRKEIEAISRGELVFPAAPLLSENAAVAMPLTETQMEVLRLMASGHKNAEIAQLLNMRESNVDYHKRNIKKILNANTSSEVITI